MKIIRWWGLVAFVGLLILLAAIWYLFAPYFIKNSIQEVATEVLGAKVEVAEVNLNLFPLSISLIHLVVTDPNEPMQNIFDSEEIKLAIDTESLLWKKIVIDEMILSGVKTATKRETSGALVGGRKSEQAAKEMIKDVVPDVNNIDIKQLVEKADLITLKRVNQLKQSQSQMQDYWKNTLDKEAFEQRVAAIKTEYERLSKRLKENKLNFLKDKKDWSELKKSIDAERKQIASLSDKLKQDKNSLTTQLKSVKNGPNDDMKAIMDKLGVSNGVEGLVEQYFGSEYTPYVKDILAMVKDFKSKNGEVAEDKPVIQVGKKVYFNDKHIFPELLIKKISLSGNSQAWILDGKGFDLGYLPWLTGKPAKLNLDLGGVAKSKGKASVAISSDWSSSTKMLTKLDAKVTNWPLQSMSFMQTDAGHWMLNSGVLNANVSGELSMEKINLTATVTINSPKLTVPEKISSWQKTFAENINNEANINFTLSAVGDVADPKIKLDSSLEKLFSNAIGTKVKQEAEKLTGKVKQSITDKVGDLSGLEEFNGNFDQWQSQISSNDDLLKSMLDKIKL